MAEVREKHHVSKGLSPTISYEKIGGPINQAWEGKILNGWEGKVLGAIGAILERLYLPAYNWWKWKRNEPFEMMLFPGFSNQDLLDGAQLEPTLFVPDGGYFSIRFTSKVHFSLDVIKVFFRDVNNRPFKPGTIEVTGIKPVFNSLTSSFNAKYPSKNPDGSYTYQFGETRQIRKNEQFKVGVVHTRAANEATQELECLVGIEITCVRGTDLVPKSLARRVTFGPPPDDMQAEGLALRRPPDGFLATPTTCHNSSYA